MNGVQPVPHSSTWALDGSRQPVNTTTPSDPSTSQSAWNRRSTTIPGRRRPRRRQIGTRNRQSTRTLGEWEGVGVRTTRRVALPIRMEPHGRLRGRSHCQPCERWTRRSPVLFPATCGPQGAAHDRARPSHRLSGPCFRLDGGPHQGPRRDRRPHGHGHGHAKVPRPALLPRSGHHEGLGGGLRCRAGGVHPRHAGEAALPGGLPDQGMALPGHQQPASTSSETASAGARSSRPSPSQTVHVPTRSSGCSRGSVATRSRRDRQDDEGHKEILLLRYYDDMSYAEIASVLEVKLGTVMSRLSRARSRLLEVIGEADHLRK